MTKIDIVSGFLGAGKTTLIKKLLEESLAGQKIVLIENEFGEIGIDGGFLKETGVDIREMNSGCICCSLVGDFGAALKEVLDRFTPDRIIIEPSGVGKLSDVIRAVLDVTEGREDIDLATYTTVADAGKCRMYMKNFGEFYNNQIESAKTIVLSRTQKTSEEKLAQALTLLREKNADAQIVTTPWDDLTGDQILSAMEKKPDFAEKLLEEIRAMEIEDEDEHEHHHHHHAEEEHEHHHHDEEEHEHHHHDEDEHEHHHHHHHHHHDGHHHADEVFDSYGEETANKYSREELETILEKMAEGSEYGVVLRAKGIVECKDGGWMEFDMVPEETEIRSASPDVTGKIVVIGTELDRKAINAAFRIGA